MYNRLVTDKIRTALTDTRVVLIAGPRQSGKTTLSQVFAGPQRPYLSLDDPTTLAAARSDPTAFIRGLDSAVIDEVQRAPQLLLPIKRSVDSDKRPGRFLLTGSANLHALPKVGDSLAGRIETIELMPLAQCEIRGRQNTFLTRAFQGKVPTARSPVIGTELVDVVLAGGYPEALTRSSTARRQKWLLDYARAVVLRDVRDLAPVDHVRQLPRLLRLLAAHSGQLTNYSALGAAIGIGHQTAHKYTDLLSQLYLVRMLMPWHSNEISRITKSPKVHFLDSGLLTALRQLTAARIKADRHSFGPVLETFVLSELLKLVAVHGDTLELFHFRDRYGSEVDLVIEDSEANIVGIEVKASATITGKDFSGLRKLQQAAGKRFVAGFVLHDSDATLPFGEALMALPVSALF